MNELLTHDGIDLRGIPVDTDRPVMVTGASGYLGSWVTAGLLQAGATVHATVRDPHDQRKTGHLHRAAQAAPGTLRLFAADLLDPGSYDEATTGCTSDRRWARPPPATASRS